MGVCCAGHPAQQGSFGRFRAFCRQLKARDAHVVPGDAAKAAFRFEHQIMVRCLASQMAPHFDLQHLNFQRHLVSRSTLRIFRAEAAAQWSDAVAAA